MEVSEVRNRLLRTIEQARRAAAERRQRVSEAETAYETFLSRVASPLFRQAASALKAEGLLFTVSTPAGSIRLSSDRNTQDFIELTLDPDRDPPSVIGRISRERGRRVISREQPVRAGASVADLTDSDLLDFLAAELAPFVER
ncbi:MAG TPA: hypothetical protein VIC33_09055 [Vicinamibacterales bacterium]|jgi:hypothetical protein